MEMPANCARTRVTGTAKEERMTTTPMTPPRRKPVARAAADDRDLAQLEQDRTRNRDEDFRRTNRIKPLDWRGEGVVGDNHTD